MMESSITSNLHANILIDIIDHKFKCKLMLYYLWLEDVNDIIIIKLDTVTKLSYDHDRLLTLFLSMVVRRFFLRKGYRDTYFNVCNVA